MQPFRAIRSKLVNITTDDIDTDQIVPARFLKITDKEGLSDKLFADWRYNADGSENPDFVLNLPGMQGRQILLAGHNFGCGSSREHAPWALSAWGFRVIISTSFADIFSNNALKNGLLLVQVDEATHRDLCAEGALDIEMTVDLIKQELSLPSGGTAQFPMGAFSKRCLLEGLDQLGYILSFRDEIERYEKNNER